MTEFMLRDAAAAMSFNYVALRYFNVAGADPEGRAGQYDLRVPRISSRLHARQPWASGTASMSTA